MRRGHRYGTIIVDLERHQPLVLLPDRQADTLVSWLLLHPSITVVSRDRAGAYAEAARRGAPQATQVADRWHLLKNLTDGLEQFFLNKRHVLKTAVLAPAVPAAGTGPGPSPPVLRAAPSAAEVVADQRHARYLAQYQRIQALAAQQIAIATIAQHVEVSRGTVYRYLRLAEPPRRKQPGRRGSYLLAPYEAYLRTRWQEGCRNAKQLGREIQAQGYRYASTTVERFIGPWRHTLGTARSFRKAAPTAAGDKRVPARPPRPYTARQAALLLTARPDQRSRVASH